MKKREKQKPIILKRLVVVTCGSTIKDNEGHEVLSTSGWTQMDRMASKIFDLVLWPSRYSVTVMTASDIASQQAGSTISGYFRGKSTKDRPIKVRRHRDRDLSNGTNEYGQVWKMINKKAIKNDFLVLVVDRSTMSNLPAWLADNMAGRLTSGISYDQIDEPMAIEFHTEKCSCCDTIRMALFEPGIIRL